MYYIQRIQVAKDGSFKYDYMGAAEFEYGEIPKAYRKFAEGYETIKTGIHAQDGRGLVVLIPKSMDKKKILEDLNKLVYEGDYTKENGYNHRNVKEPTYLREALGLEKDEYRSRINCWFSVNTDDRVFIAFLGEKLENEVKNYISEFLLKQKNK